MQPRCLPGVSEEIRQSPHFIPVTSVKEHPGEDHGTADHLRPEHASVRIGVQELGLPVTTMLTRDFVAGLCRENVYLSGGFQQFSREEEKLFAFCGQFSRSFLVPSQQAVSEDGWPYRLAQRQVRGHGRGQLDGAFLLGHAELQKAPWAKARRDTIEYGLNFPTYSIGHSVSRYRARSSSSPAAAATPSSESLSAGDSTRSTARKPKWAMPARRRARSTVA